MLSHLLQKRNELSLHTHKNSVFLTVTLADDLKFRQNCYRLHQEIMYVIARLLIMSVNEGLDYLFRVTEVTFLKLILTGEM